MKQLVRYVDGYYEFLQDNDVVYDFECETAERALRWIEHMSQKTWVTKQHIEQFVTLLAARLNVGHI